MWETTSELNNWGFNLWRGASPDGPDLKLNETLIPSQSQGNPGGFEYSWGIARPWPTARRTTTGSKTWTSTAR
jgi:hypothetical protein